MIEGTRFDFSRLRAFRNALRVGERPEREPETAARFVCIASGKGGTGKSIVASNLAALRAARGERVLLVDFDAGFANAHLLFGLAPRHDLLHVMAGEVRALDALVEGPGGLKLLSGGVGRHALANPTRRELDRLFAALKPLETEFDLVIVDHGAGLGYGTVASLAATSTLLLVTGHEVTALSDAYALYKRALAVNPEIRVGAVLNRCRDVGQVEAAWTRFQGAAERFLGRSPEFVGWVPADLAVEQSVQLRQPVVLAAPECPASRALAHVARWAPIEEGEAGGEVEEPEKARTSRAFTDRARRALR